MPTDYNKIAEKYVAAKTHPWRSLIEEYSFMRLIGEVDGLRIVDLACGSGHYTRKIKARGASQVVGVDISQAMIDLARAEEEREPLGIEYQVADASGDGPQYDFDLAISAYLLPYAKDYDSLDSYCYGIARYIRAGRRFVTVTANNNVYHYPRDAYDPYDFKVDLEDEAKLGAKIIWQNWVNGEWVPIETYYIPHEAYKTALESAGFHDVKLIDPGIDRARLSEFQPGYWDNLVKYPVCLLIEATRS